VTPRVRCYYWGESRPVVNLGDALVPLLLDALGLRPVECLASDDDVINPGRCLLVIGSLLTREDVARIGYPLDVWGCGWKGADSAPDPGPSLRLFAVRGPDTAAGLHLPADTPLGDPALLTPQLLPVPRQPHGRSIVMPHFSRLTLMTAAERRLATSCDDAISPLVRMPRNAARSLLTSPRALMRRARRWRRGFAPFGVYGALARVAGARFVLTGSLHGAILAQAFGVPWACYYDGYLDAPAKWQDWGAYLGVDIEAVATLADGERWWHRTGHRGRVRDLAPLLRAFPYPQYMRLPGTPQQR
jgi:hypothetical protein